MGREVLTSLIAAGPRPVISSLEYRKRRRAALTVLWKLHGMVALDVLLIGRRRGVQLLHAFVTHYGFLDTQSLFHSTGRLSIGAVEAARCRAPRAPHSSHR
jgi:hypothetical protein